MSMYPSSSKKPVKDQDSYFNDEPKKPNPSNVQPSQKKAPKQPYQEK